MSDLSEEPWWKKLGYGLANLGIAGFLYWYITSFELAGGAWRLNWTVAILYAIAGKWIPCSVIAFIGVFCVAIGIYERTTQR